MYEWKKKQENKGIRVEAPKDKPYLVTGYQAYLIGSQTGEFPKRGAHIPHEMWGMWVPPIKVMDGFELSVEGETMKNPECFEMLPIGCSFTYRQKEGLVIERLQWIPQREKGLIVELVFRNETSSDWTGKLGVTVHAHLMPTWLSEQKQIEDGCDRCLGEAGEATVYFRDEKNDWTLCLEASEEIRGLQTEQVAGQAGERHAACEAGPEAEQATGQGAEPEKGQAAKKDAEQTAQAASCLAKLTFELEVPTEGEKKIELFFAASLAGKESARQEMRRIRENKEELFLEKVTACKEQEQKAFLRYPAEPLLEEMYHWNQYINDWIIREVDGIGKGVVAGYPEFPWWFGNDTNYIVPAMLMQGKGEICKETLRLLKRKSLETNGNGRVVHEVSNNGVVYYEGMSTETPQFADTVWTIYCFDGDRAFLEEMYDFCELGMNYMESISTEGLPRGYGISEIAGLDCCCCDSALLAIRGYECMSLISGALGLTEKEQKYARRQKETWDLFQKEFFMPQLGYYGDMVATREEIIERAQTWQYTLHSFPISEEDKILSESSCKQDKTPEGKEEKKRLREKMERILKEAGELEEGCRRPYDLFGLEHARIAVEFDYPDRQAKTALLAAMEKKKREEPFAVEAIMPIGIGRRIVSLGNVGDARRILEALREVAKGFGAGMPGTTSEIYPENGCFVQAWNSFATMWPYCNSLFGIKPRADLHRIRLRPCLCESMKGLELRNLQIGGQSFSFRYLGNGEIEVTLPDESWRVELEEDGQAQAEEDRQAQTDENGRRTAAVQDGAYRVRILFAREQIQQERIQVAAYEEI